jgi:hypothetical protein
MALFGSKHRFSDSSNWFKRHSLSLALIGVLLIQAVITITTGHEQFVSDAKTHGDTPNNSAFALWIIYELTVSVIADTYGALLLVLFAKWFYEEGSPESSNE